MTSFPHQSTPPERKPSHVHG
jgi:hypothetical protein